MKTNARVQIEVRKQPVQPPAILSLKASPLGQSAIAPATFRITSESQNVQTCVWDFGRPTSPLEISSESPNHQEKLVTFDKPGQYFVQLAAINDKQSDRKWVPIDVKSAPANTLMARAQRRRRRRANGKDNGHREAHAARADGSAQPFEKTIPIATGILRDGCAACRSAAGRCSQYLHSAERRPHPRHGVRREFRPPADRSSWR